MRRTVKLIGLVGLIFVLCTDVYCQSEPLKKVVDSLIKTKLTFNIDTCLTRKDKPDPLVVIDGYVTNITVLRHLEMKNIKSIDAGADSLAFQMFDPIAWGGFIFIETNLKKRKLKRILSLAIEKINHD